METKARSSLLPRIGGCGSNKTNPTVSGFGNSVVIWSLLAWCVVRTLPEIWDRAVVTETGFVKSGGSSGVGVDRFPWLSSAKTVDTENSRHPSAGAHIFNQGEGRESAGSAGLIAYICEKLFGGVRHLLEAFVRNVGASTMKCWTVLVVAVFTETGATTLSKWAMLDSSPFLLALSCILVILSECFMTVALARIDVGIAYAIWAAIGTGAVSLAGILFFDERCDVTKAISLALIVLGVVGLSLGETSSST